MEVYIDPRNTNEWTLCTTINNLNLPSGWLSRSHIGITATTGQLADNHDVIYLKSFTNATVLEQDEDAEINTPHFEMPQNTHSDEKFKA